MSNIYLDRAGADTCVNQINTQVQELQEAARAIDSAMMNLQEMWKGTSADKAQDTYATEFKQMLTETVPNAVDEFKQFMDSCVKAIYETDQQLSGS